MRRDDQHVRLAVFFHERLARFPGLLGVVIGAGAPFGIAAWIGEWIRSPVNTAASAPRASADREVVRRVAGCRLQPDLVVERVVAGDQVGAVFASTMGSTLSAKWCSVALPCSASQ